MSALSLPSCHGVFALLASNPEAAPIIPSSPWIMLLFAAIMLASYVGVAIEPMHKTVAALCGATVLIGLSLALNLFEYEKIYEILEEDLNIFGVIIGTGILVDVIGKSGLFLILKTWKKWIASYSKYWIEL